MQECISCCPQSIEPNLAKVIVMEHPPRFDDDYVDPIYIKPALAKFANTTFNNLWMESPWKSKIIVAGHSLQCNDKERVARYTDKRTQRYDGIHMYDEPGKEAFTKSLINTLTNAVSAPLVVMGN